MAFQFPEFAILALAITITMLTGGIDLSIVGIANCCAIVSALILTRLAPGRCRARVAPAVLRRGAGGRGRGGAFQRGADRLPWPAADSRHAGLGADLHGACRGADRGDGGDGLPRIGRRLGNGTLLGLPVPLIVFGSWPRA
jgi:simple sugar transport system permease protein